MPEPVVPIPSDPPPATDPPPADPPPVVDPPPADPPKPADPPADPPKPPGAPEAYEFTAPEGRQYDAEFVKAFSEEAKALDLPQDKAQAVLDKLSETARTRQEAVLAEVRTGWIETSKTDKEFGGDKLEENLGIAKKAVEKFGSPELKEFLNSTGLGNHPELVRIFFRVGKAISEDTFVGGHKVGSGQPQSFNDLASRMYPNS